jgi:hypothetical protein
VSDIQFNWIDTQINFHLFFCLASTDYIISLSRKTSNARALLKQKLQYSLLIKLKLHLKNVLCTSSWICQVSIACWYIPGGTIRTLSSLFKCLLCMRKNNLSFQSIWSHSLFSCVFLLSCLLLYCSKWCPNQMIFVLWVHIRFLMGRVLFSL